MNDFPVDHRRLFMTGAVHGPERDAADFMAELQNENPETYETWLRITSRDEFNEKFRRSFISALCKFCISRKQMELARYRREFVASVLAYTKADIGVNLFCDKNGGGFLNNSLKSRRAYQKRRRECGWQEEASAPTSFLQQGSTLSTLLQTFRQQQQTIQTSPTSVAEMLRRTNSLDPIQMRSSSPAHAEHHSTTLADSPLAETMVKVSDRASSSSSSSTTAASFFNVFVRYRKVNQEDGWKDVEVKQSKLSFGSFATVQHLYSTAVEKWRLGGEDADRLILRIFDKDFEEFVDIEENFALVSLENLAKYELIHRVSDGDAFKTKAGDPKNNNILFDSKNATNGFSQGTEVPGNDITNILRIIQESASTGDESLNNENPLDAFVRNAALLLRSSQTVDEKSFESLPHPFYSLLNSTNLSFNPTELLENLHSLISTPNVEDNVDILDILSKTENGRFCLQNFKALETGSENLLSNGVKAKLIGALGQWLVLNCQKIGNPSKEEKRTFVESVIEQLPIKLDRTVFLETLETFVQNHQQLSCGVLSRKDQAKLNDGLSYVNT